MRAVAGRHVPLLLRTLMSTSVVLRMGPEPLEPLEPPEPLVPVPLTTHQSCEAADPNCDAHAAGPGRVLVIYTGGTMGMTSQDGSLAPQRGFLPDFMREMNELHDPSMPELDILEYDPLLDSSNIAPEDWSLLAGQIREHYYDYDGFVIIHGTDTMAYTASALSFMLEGLGKAVVLTGSMIPIQRVYNDARRNLIISIVFAAQLELSEVVVFFNDRLLRGNRAVKMDSSGLAAFDSPNFPPLATVGTSISAARHLWRPPPASRLRVHTKLDSSVVVVRLAPGFDDSAIESMVRHATHLSGLVLSLYGTGNGPSRKSAFLGTIEAALANGVCVIAASQCVHGTVALETYEVGQRLLALGVVSAGDMTTEACVTKLAYLAGRGFSGERLRDALLRDLRGERSNRPSAEPSSFGGFLGSELGARSLGPI